MAEPLTNTDVSSSTEDIARQIADWVAAGRPVTTGRVIGIEGFSTWPGAQLVAFDGTGARVGEVLGAPGTGRLGPAAAELQASGGGRTVVDVEIHGLEVAAAGLSCGGRAEVLLESAAAVPAGAWSAMAARRPVALVTPLHSAGASTLVEADGACSGPPLEDDLLATASTLLTSGQSGVRRTSPEEGTTWLMESWVPVPRLVIVGGGDLAAAITAQAALLGWESRATERDDVADLLAWAGGSDAVAVLSHDPHVDTPALRAALAAGVAYVGAMGSRATQSRRLERLAAAGVSGDQLDRIHRPIGLDLGGRGAAEVALSICAEILAVRCGRDGRPLRDRQAPIHDTLPLSGS